VHYLSDGSLIIINSLNFLSNFEILLRVTLPQKARFSCHCWLYFYFYIKQPHTR